MSDPARGRSAAAVGGQMDEDPSDAAFVCVSQAALDAWLRTGPVIGMQKDGKFFAELKRFLTRNGAAVENTGIKDYLLLHGVPGLDRPCLLRLGKNGDLISLLDDGLVDCVIAGEDMYAERMLASLAKQEITGRHKPMNAIPLATLDIPAARCELRMLLPEGKEGAAAGELAGRRAYSKYINLTRQFFSREFPVNDVEYAACAGGTETNIAAYNARHPGDRWAFGTDIVQTGDTARQAGLIPTAGLGTSEALVIVDRRVAEDGAKRAMLKALFSHLGVNRSLKTSPRGLLRFVASVDDGFWSRIDDLARRIDEAPLPPARGHGRDHSIVRRAGPELG